MQVLKEIFDNLPESWDDVSIGEYVQIEGILKDEYYSKFSQSLEIISIFSGYNIEFFDEFSTKELLDLIEKVNFHATKPKHEFKKEFDDFKAINFSKMSWGELIDLGAWTKDKIKNYGLILSVIYRKEGETYDDIDVFERAAEFEDVCVNDVIGAFAAFDKHHKENITSVYLAIYETDEGDEFNTEGLSPQEIEDIKNDLEKEKQLSEFIWYRYLHELSGGNLLVEEELLKRPYIQIFNTLTAKKNLGLLGKPQIEL